MKFDSFSFTILYFVSLYIDLSLIIVFLVVFAFIFVHRLSRGVPIFLFAHLRRAWEISITSGLINGHNTKQTRNKSASHQIKRSCRHLDDTTHQTDRF
jgi:hypothetical protein